MGIYQVDLIVPNEFPLTLAKLAIWIQYFEERDALSDDLKLTIKIPGNDEPIFTADFDRAGMTKNIPKYPYEVPESEKDRQLSITAPVVFSPLVIPQEGFIRVAMQRGELSTGLGRLMVRKARPDEMAQFAIFPANASQPPS